LRAGALRRPVQLTVHRAANVAELTAPLPGSGGASSVHALTALRQRLIPQTLGRVPGVQALIDGQLAASLDYNSALRSAAIRAFAFVMAAAFVLMLASLGSVVIAATCVLLDLLSVGAAYGVMALLGDRNWYLPKWLAWLPRISHGAPDLPGGPGQAPDGRLRLPASVGS